MELSLTERQDNIVRAVVEAYTGTGRPVGSAAVLERAGLSVSSATIRNELAALEDLGLLLQLHTSGGRIPTTSGYRYYIEHLLPSPVLGDEDQITIRHQFHQVHTELDAWLKLAAAVVAHRAGNVALITSPRVEAAGFKHVELIESQPHTVLTIVVLADGSVQQELMATDLALEQETLRSYTDELNRVFAGVKSASQIRSRSVTLPHPLRPFADTVERLMRRAVDRRFQIYHEGLSEMLRRPEFSPQAHPNLAEGDRLRRVLDFLQQSLAIEDLLSVLAMERGVQVMIGGEAPLIELEDYSLVVGRYGDQHESTGVLGVLGPVRMDYGRAISLVRYMSDLMTDLIFGPGRRSW